MPTLRSIDGEPLLPVIQVNAAAAAETEVEIPSVQDTVAPSPPQMETEAPGATVDSSPLVSDQVEVSHNGISSNVAELVGGRVPAAEFPDIPPLPLLKEAQAALQFPVITTVNQILSPAFSSLSGGTSNISSSQGSSFMPSPTNLNNNFDCHSFQSQVGHVSIDPLADVEVEDESVDVSGSIRKRKNGSSFVWNFFDVYSEREKSAWAYCRLCKSDVNYSESKSTGMLNRHLRMKHREVYEQCMIAEDAKKAKVSSVGQKKQESINRYVQSAPSFEKCCVDWLIATYQPLSMVEEPTFRKLCFSLNCKAPIIGKDKIRHILSLECAKARSKVIDLLKGNFVTATADGWTACNNVSYVTCTAHFISDSWVLHHFPLGIFEKKGRSRAEDIVGAVEGIWDSYNIFYTNLVSLVTDTEATMVKSGRLFKQNALQHNVTLEWHGCIAHLLELVTGEAFKDYPASEGAMKAAREMVGFFKHSSQAEAILTGKQVAGRAVKPIQDVETRWWSTHSMCSRLVRLKPYLDLMEAEGTLSCNLNPDQWKVVQDTCQLLEPFMCAQRMMEGESYVTVSMYPYIMHKIRGGVVRLIDRPSSQQVFNLARKMNRLLEEHWGCGDPGTIAQEHLTTGPRQRPKGIPKIALLASLLDPRFKFGAGLGEEDKTILWRWLEEEMTAIAQAQAMVVENNTNNYDAGDPQRRMHPNQPQRSSMYDDLFEDLQLLAAANNNNNAANVINNNNNEDPIEERVQAEAVLYRQEAHLPLKDQSGRWNNPLEWWKVKQHQFPLLAALAKKYLGVPATSAPSERVFSTAGLTIANLRTRLLPDTAAELVFLHDALPAIDKYCKLEVEDLE